MPLASFRRWIFAAALVAFAALGLAKLTGTAPMDMASPLRADIPQGTPGAAFFSARDGDDFGLVLLDIQTQQAAVAYHVPRRGVYVLTVDGDSPADRAGIRPGDCIEKAGGEEVSSAEQVMESLGSLASGGKLDLTIIRGLNSFVLTVRADAAEDEL